MITEAMIKQCIERLKEKSRPSRVNGKFNNENASFNTALAEGIDILYELLEAVKERSDDICG